MLKRIHIKGYKSLQDVELDLPPLAVVFGPNAAGKSNFLDALQLLSRLATSRTLRDAFAPPYRGKPLESFSFGRDGLRGLLGRKQLRLSMEADIELSETLVDAVNGEIQQMRGSWPSPPGGGATAGRSALPPVSVRERNLRYRLEVEMAPKSGELRLHDEYLGALTRNARPKRIRPFLERHDDLILLRRDGEQDQVRYGRKDCSVLSQPHYPPQHPQVLAARREFESWRFHYLEPRERMRSEDPVGEVRRIGPMGEGLAAFLNTLKSSAPKQFQALEKALRALVPNVDGIDVKVNDHGEAEICLKENGSEVSARLLSDGTLRMLGLLALTGAVDVPTLVGFEEPENGVHPGRIDLIASFLNARRMTGQTQFIVTTHSPVLPDLLPNDSLLVAGRQGGHTRIEPFSDWGPDGRREHINEALGNERPDTTQEPLPISRRLLRGDFDA